MVLELCLVRFFCVMRVKRELVCARVSRVSVCVSAPHDVFLTVGDFLKNVNF